LLFLSGPGSTDNNSDPAIQEEGIVQIGGNWVVTFEGQSFNIKNPPEAVVDISVESSIAIENYIGQILYMDTKDNGEIEREVFSLLGRYVTRAPRACHGPCEEDLPEKDCSQNIIIWEESTTNKVYQEQNCIFIEGDVMAVDAFIYYLMGYSDAKAPQDIVPLNSPTSHLNGGM